MTTWQELDSLLDRMVDGLLDEQDAVKLNDMLRNDPAARHRYVRYVQLHGRLLWCDAESSSVECGEGAEENLLQQTEVGIESPVLASPGPSAARPIVLDLSSSFGSPKFTLQSSLTHFVFSYLVATVLIFVGLLAGMAWRISLPSSAGNGSNFPSIVKQQPVSTPIVAQITGLSDCQWTKQGTETREEGRGERGEIPISKSPNPQIPVFLGDRFLVSSGLMQITYRTGAKVILEGPCSYQIDSKRSGYLAVGKLTAKVEKGSEIRGPGSGNANHAPLFAVRTPTAVVTDLGTEFGVEVEESGATHSHVFQGTIELRPNDVRGLALTGAPSILQAGESARVEQSRKQLAVILGKSGQSGQFIRQMPHGVRGRRIEGGADHEANRQHSNPQSPIPNPFFRLIDLGTLGGRTSRAFAMNEAGQVVGQSMTADGATHAFLYGDGKMQDLGAFVPDGGDSAALGINASGQIVGILNDSKTNRGQAFLFSDGAMEVLGTLGGQNARANAINDAGQVAGTSLNSLGVRRAFVYDREQGMRDLGALGGPKSASQAYSINATGLVAGCSKTDRGHTHAFLYVPGAGMKDLGALGGNRSEAFGVGPDGQVVGIAGVNKASRHAFLYDESSGMKDLGTLGGPASCALDINHSGHVVGRATLVIHRRPQNHAFLYRNGKIHDLNYLFLAPSKGWTMHGAIAINDAGQIAGSATGPDGNVRAVLLTPFTESEMRNLSEIQH